MRDEPKINDGCIAWRLNMDPICCITAAINSDVHFCLKKCDVTNV